MRKNPPFAQKKPFLDIKSFYDEHKSDTLLLISAFQVVMFYMTRRTSRSEM